jgi:PAS domain-containing protein
MTEETDLRSTLESLGDVAFTVDAEGRYDLVTDALATFHGTEREDMRVQTEFDAGDDRQKIVDTRLSRHTDDGEFDAVVVVWRDVTADERRRTGFAGLHDAASSIQTEDTVAGVCERAVAAAADVLEFTLCTVLIREDEWLVPYATSADAPPDASRRMRLDQGLAGTTYRTGTTRVVEEVTPDDGTDPAKEFYRSGISVPVGDHGVFQAVSSRVGAFDETDVELAELLLSHAERALDRIERGRELRMYEAIVETTRDTAAVLDADRRFVVVNSRLADTYGATPAELRGRSGRPRTVYRTAAVASSMTSRASFSVSTSTA